MDTLCQNWADECLMNKFQYTAPDCACFFGTCINCLTTLRDPSYYVSNRFERALGFFRLVRGFPQFLAVGRECPRIPGRAYASSQNPKQACFVSSPLHAGSSLPRLVLRRNGLGGGDRQHLRRDTRLQRGGSPRSPSRRP